MTRIDANAREFRFVPSVWSVPSGEEVVVTLTNSGSVIHQWILIAGQKRFEEEAQLAMIDGKLDPSVVLVELHAAPGESMQVQFTSPALGRYQVICAVPSHLDQGMEGTLEVTGP